MSGDYSRQTFDALNDFSGVFLQQGRPILDADWNEMVRIFERRIRAECIDTIGRAVVPRETPSGFEITFTDDGGLAIGRGRKYLDGLLLECHGAAEFDGEPQPGLDPPVFDRARPGNEGPEGVLDELISTEAGDFLSYGAQPYWPTPEPLPGQDDAGNATGGPHIAYVVAWQREVTAVEDPALLDPALGGIDTTTRWQTVWQVRLHAVPQGTTCTTPDGQIEEWADLIRPSNARLTVDTIEIEDPEDPCLVPPSDGYVGRENQKYRVAIHDITANGTIRFKYSRENASVVAGVEAIESPANTVTVNRIGRDTKLSFREGDWVELTDDHREFNHLPGRMLRIEQVIEETRQIVFDREIDSDMPGRDLIPDGLNGDTLAARHTRLIRWDQNGEITLASGDDHIDLDAPETEGLIPVPADGSAIHLEAGVTVQFTTDGPGAPHPLDWWCFWARTAGTQVERRLNAPPDGIQRHYCRLAVVDFPDSIDDCRVFWPPEFEGGGETHECGCTVCVDADGHNSGALTIQDAINQIGPGGGTVCLEAGSYLLRTPLVIEGGNAIRLKGQGIGTILVYRGTGAAIRVREAADTVFDRFTLFVLPREDAAGNLPPAHGITAVNCAVLSLQRLAVAVFSPSPDNRRDHAIGLDGAHMGAEIENCVCLAPIALGNRSSFDTDDEEPDDPTFVAFAELRARDNILFGGREAVRFDRVAINLAAAAFSGNLALGGGTGMRLNWADLPVASTLIEGSTALGSAAGMILGAGDVRVNDCEITADAQVGVGLRTTANLVPEAETDLRLIGNGIADLGGAGIRLAGRHGAVLIKQNLIRRCLSGGISVAPEAQIAHLAIDNNVVEDIADFRGAPGAAAISLAATATAHVAGNRIRGVGREGRDGEIYHGLSGQGVGALTAVDNSISEIGPESAEAPSIGIAIRRPYGQVAVRGNRIETRRDLGAFTSWAAIEIGRPPGDFPSPSPNAPGLVATDVGSLTVLPGEVPEAAAYVTLAAETIRITPDAVAVIAIGLRTTLAVTASQIRAETASNRPLVTLYDGGAISIDCSHNQLLQAGREFADAQMMVGCRRIAAASNTVQHSGERISIALVTGVGLNAAATPIGNITSSRITLNGDGVSPPFAALNLIA